MNNQDDNSGSLVNPAFNSDSSNKNQGGMELSEVRSGNYGSTAVVGGSAGEVVDTSAWFVCGHGC